METKEIEQIAKKELKKMGFNVKWKGYYFWATAVAVCNDFSCKITYNRVAQKYRSTASKVEKAMRYAVDFNMTNIQEFFEINHKITNAEFFYLLKEKLDEKVNCETG